MMIQIAQYPEEKSYILIDAYIMKYIGLDLSENVILLLPHANIYFYK